MPDNPRGIVSPNYLQILFGGSILVLSLIVPIVAYTNHVKRAAALVGPTDLVQAPAEASGAMLSAKPPSESDQTDHSSPERVQAQLTKSAGTDQESSHGLTKKKIVGNRPLQKQVTKAVPKRRPSPNISRTWYRKSPLKSTLIALWRQTLRKTPKPRN